MHLALCILTSSLHSFTLYARFSNLASENVTSFLNI